MIGDIVGDAPVVQAKQQYVEQMAIASRLGYHMIKCRDADAHCYQRFF